jgi:hypothetical protein
MPIGLYPQLLSYWVPRSLRPWMRLGKVFDGPWMLVVVARVAWWFIAGLEARAQERERAGVALAHHKNPSLEEQRRRDADALLIAPRSD